MVTAGRHSPNATETGRSILTRILFLLDLGVIYRGEQEETFWIAHEAFWFYRFKCVFDSAKPSYTAWHAVTGGRQFVLRFPTMQLSISSSPFFWSRPRLCFWVWFSGCRTTSFRTSVSIWGSWWSRGWAFLITWSAWRQTGGRLKDRKNRPRQTDGEDTNQSMLWSGKRLQDFIHDAIRQQWCHAQLHFTVSHTRKKTHRIKLNIEKTKTPCYRTGNGPHVGGVRLQRTL